MEVEVDELCTITVANKPTMRPAMGLEKIAPSEKIFPVTLPVQTKRSNLLSLCRGTENQFARTSDETKRGAHDVQRADEQIQQRQ